MYGKGAHLGRKDLHGGMTVRHFGFVVGWFGHLSGYILRIANMEGMDCIVDGRRKIDI